MIVEPPDPLRFFAGPLGFFLDFIGRNFLDINICIKDCLEKKKKGIYKGVGGCVETYLAERGGKRKNKAKETLYVEV